MVVRTGNKSGSIGGFLKRTQRTLLDTPWQIIQVMETGQPGNYNSDKLVIILKNRRYLEKKLPSQNRWSFTVRFSK